MRGSAQATDRVRFGCCGSMISPAIDPVGGEIVEELAAVGYDYVELSIRDLVVLPERSLATLIARLQRAGVACEACNNFFPPEIRLTGPAVDPAAALRYAQRALDTAARLGASVIIFGSSEARNVPAGFPHEAAWAQLRTLLGSLGPLAEQHGITISIEHLNRGESNILTTVSEAWRLVREVAHPCVRLLIDAYHMRMENEDPAILAVVASAIAHVHVAEGDGRVFPSGHDDMLAAFFAQLRGIGYAGRCSVEAYTRDFSADAARGLRACRDLVTANLT